MRSEHTETNTGNGRAWREGDVARNIEQRTAKLPSDLFLWAALGAMGLSATAQIVGMLRGRGILGTNGAPLSTFIGQWAPTLLLFGVYNKIVKLHGSDRTDQMDEGE